MTNSVSAFWPVNSLGEIIFEAGVGNTTKVGYLPSHFIPQDPITKAVPAVGLGGGGGNTTTSIKINPSGDTTGVTDRQSIATAISSVASAGGGLVQLSSKGQWYVASTDVATTNTDKGIPIAAGVSVQGEGRRATKIIVVGGSKCNIFVAENVNNWSIRNLYLDGNRTDPAMPQTGGSQDAWRNGVRVVSCTDWEVSDCTFTRFPYHGGIGVGVIANCRVYNNDFTLSGFRGFHLHSESGTPSKISVTSNRLNANGQSIFTGFNSSGQVQAGALTKLRLSATDATNLASCYANGVTTVTVAIPNAGTGGATHFSTATLSGTNPDGSNDLTLDVTAAQASGVVTYNMATGSTAGLFVVFGCNDVIIANNEIYNEQGIGIHITGTSTDFTGKLVLSNNLVDNCYTGIVLGAKVTANPVEDIIAYGNKVTNSVFNGVEINNVNNLNWDGDVFSSGMVGVNLTTIGTAQQYVRVGGQIRGSGSMGMYASGGGEIGALHIDADTHNNGANAGFNITTATIFGTSPQGWAQGIFVNAGSSGKFHSVVVDGAISRRNSGGACHVNTVDHAVVNIKSCVDNSPTSGFNPIAIRMFSVLGGSIQNCDVLLQSRTNTNYAISASGCTNVKVRGNYSNYTRSTNIIYVDGTGCTAYDNTGPAGTSVQFANGGAATSDAANQRVA